MDGSQDPSSDPDAAPNADHPEGTWDDGPLSAPWTTEGNRKKAVADRRLRLDRRANRQYDAARGESSTKREAGSEVAQHRPQSPSLGLVGIDPVVRLIPEEVQRVTTADLVMLARDVELEGALEDVDQFLAWVNQWLVAAVRARRRTRLTSSPSTATPNCRPVRCANSLPWRRTR